MHDPFSFIYEPKKKETESYEQLQIELYDFPVKKEEIEEEESVFTIQIIDIKT